MYWSFRGEITINRGLLMKADTEMKEDILSKIHRDYQMQIKDKRIGMVAWR